MLACLTRRFRAKGLTASLALSTLFAIVCLSGCVGTPGMDPPADENQIGNSAGSGAAGHGGTGGSSGAVSTMDGGPPNAGGSGAAGSGQSDAGTGQAGSGGGNAGSDSSPEDAGMDIDAGDAGDAGDEDGGVTR